MVMKDIKPLKGGAKMISLVGRVLIEKRSFIIGLMVFLFHAGAYSSTCVSKMTSTKIEARDTEWISPFSGYTSPDYTLLGNEQLFTYSITFQGTCIPKISPNFASLPDGVHIQVGVDFRYMVNNNYVDASYTSSAPVEITAFAFYFITVDSFLPEANINGNLLSVIDGDINLSTNLLLRVDKTPPSAIQASEFGLQCLYVDLSKNEYILAEPKWISEPLNQAPLSYIVGFLSSDVENNMSYILNQLYSRRALSLFATDGGYYPDVQIGPKLLIKSKDYGQPIQFVRFDKAHNRSEFSQKYTFSKSTINARYDKRTGRCTAK